MSPKLPREEYDGTLTLATFLGSGNRGFTATRVTRLANGRATATHGLLTTVGGLVVINFYNGTFGEQLASAIVVDGILHILTVEDTATLCIDHFSLIIVYLIIIKKILTDSEVVVLYLLLLYDDIKIHLFLMLFCLLYFQEIIFLKYYCLIDKRYVGFRLLQLKFNF